MLSGIRVDVLSLYYDRSAVLYPVSAIDYIVHSLNSGSYVLHYWCSIVKDKTTITITSADAPNIKMSSTTIPCSRLPKISPTIITNGDIRVVNGTDRRPLYVQHYRPIASTGT